MIEEKIFDSDGNILYINYKNDQKKLIEQKFYFNNGDTVKRIRYRNNKIIMIMNLIYNHAEEEWHFQSDYIHYDKRGNIFIHEFYNDNRLIKKLYCGGQMQVEN
jgi:hypothetical protein